MAVGLAEARGRWGFESRAKMNRIHLYKGAEAPAEKALNSKEVNLLFPTPYNQISNKKLRITFPSFPMMGYHIHWPSISRNRVLLNQQTLLGRHPWEYKNTPRRVYLHWFVLYGMEKVDTVISPFPQFIDPTVVPQGLVHFYYEYRSSFSFHKSNALKYTIWRHCKINIIACPNLILKLVCCDVLSNSDAVRYTIDIKKVN